MPDDNRIFDLPPKIKKADGANRKVGFELEFSGLTIDQAVEAVQTSLNASLRSETTAEKTLDAEGLGSFSVELDWELLKRLADKATQKDNNWIETLSQTAAMIVPIEVVCPPIEVEQLFALEQMVKALRNAGAKGTEESPIAAYGVHINVELPNLDTHTINAYVTAFCLLQWWLSEARDVNITRKISPYVALFSETYVKTILSRKSPGMVDIFEDYLTHNASRNRALDLLPLLAHIDEKRVFAAVDDPKIKARPALHYRLPNCHIEDPDWSLNNSWNVWQIVEKLASSPEDLEYLSSKFFEYDRPLIGIDTNEWNEFIDKWLKDQKLA
ncbi:amidoligase family protein [Terasakiella sp. A23]|uniref:amidoligase family protein n=1 Tax=Terasakiella sp. FCG-A23 TaxID=3080561 RepID=UPI002954B296|nr:amidoligase family protein [Terasakiella sp. A23]MDV7340925.1 amidoligase family protein [Terasakiella sp. A23]